MINRWYAVAFLALCGVASAYAQSGLIPQNQVWAGPSSGGPGFAGPRALVAADLPNGGAPSGTAGGGLTGTYPNPTVAAVPASALPAPTVSTPGGVKSKAAVTHNFLTQIGTDGSVSQAQPACGDLSNGATGCSTAYTQGTWTPTITTNGTAGTPAYSFQVGSFEQIGRLVVAHFSISLSGWTGSPTGVVEISLAGLPAAGATTNDFGSCYFGTYAITGAAGDIGLTGLINAGSSLVILQTNAQTGSVNLTPAIAGTTPTIVGACIYHT